MKTKNLYKALLLTSICMVVATFVGCKSAPTIDEMTVRMRETDEVKLVDMRSIMVNNLLKVDVSVNVKSTKKSITYRFHWLDKNKFRVYGDEAWKPIPVGSGQSGVIQGIAPGPAAVDFKLELSSD
jgi:uncharacterized protein YcfL